MHRHIIAIAALTAGCMPEDDATENELVPASGAPRFYEDVAPILAASCGSCHREGGVAPMSFASYEETKAWAPVIRAAVLARTMPPFNVNNDGTCNTFTDARWLTPEEMQIIDEWVEADAPEGDASLGMPAPPALPVLEGPRVRLLQLEDDYVPAGEDLAVAQHDDYQCFLIDPELDKDEFVVGFDVEPGNAAIVHHVLAFNVDLERQTLLPGGGIASNRAVIEELEAADPDPGWDCFAAAGENVMIESVPVTWAPGTGATQYPEGTGIRIGKDEVIVVQMHYNLVNGGGAPDRTGVKLAFADEVEREAHMLLADGFLQTLLGTPATLEPGLAEAKYAWSTKMSELPYIPEGLGDVEVMGILPHMHQRGQHMEVSFGVEAGSMCGADVDRWDFGWQQAFFLEEPLRVTMEDTLDVTCTWDTRAETAPVGPGFGTGDEMCLVGLYLVEAR